MRLNLINESHVAKNTKALYRMQDFSIYTTSEAFKLTFILMRRSAIACEIPNPSRGEVPRPSSSIRTKELKVDSPL